MPLDAAIPPIDGSSLDDEIAAAEAAHPDQSAFRLVSDGVEAFALRAVSARHARRSLDVQTYIWHPDLTGMLLARELLDAADRGVKLRLLVDDLDARARSMSFAALSAHPNIAVRVFNPFVSRTGKLRLIAEALRSFRRINHRMHNKTWIADDRIALAGGRNLGDEYFGAGDAVNFVDLDVAMIGPVVRDAAASFDTYWSSPAVCPIGRLHGGDAGPADLEALRARLAHSIGALGPARYAEALRANDAVRRLVAGDWPMEWSAGHRFVSDDPLKATMKDRDPGRSHVGTLLVDSLRGMQSEFTVISPYFVPGKVGRALLVDGARAGKRVRVLTNSLVANDVAAVHGGYSRARGALLEGGVQIWELKPKPGARAKRSLLGSSGASLHTKALTVDGRALFVGSYNLDPRSTWLNCEQGVLIESEVLARQLGAIFAAQTAGARSWQVTLGDGRLRWSDGSETFDRDPDASRWQRLQAWLARVLHLDAQL